MNGGYIVSFEIKQKDALGRIGVLKTASGSFETPTIMPVMNPNPEHQPISGPDLYRLGARTVITNAYIIHSHEDLRARALDEGLHGLTKFPGPVATDSGGFQIYTYGNVDVDAADIEAFQEDIGSDLAVILDTPPPLDLPKAKVRAAIDVTLKRARENVERRRKDDVLWYGPVHGHMYKDLVKRSARGICELDFPVVAIGSSVQMLVRYMFAANARSVANVREHLPADRPVHLFGAGHPLYMAAAVMLGVDLFDSAFYVLAARDNRYITLSGTLHLDQMTEFPCSCEVCSRTSPGELMKADRATRTKALATHNLIVTLEELARIREAIRSGTLLELALRRMRSHPRMAEILDDFKRYGKLMEPFDPVSKRSALLYTGPETRYRPEVVRFQRRLYERFDGPARDVLAVIPDPGMTPFASSGIHVRARAWVHTEHPDASVQYCTSSHLFGVVPEQLEEAYPVAQCLYPPSYRGRPADVRRFIDAFGERYGTVLILTGKERVSGNVDTPLPDHVETVRALADHQLYRGARALIPDGSRVKRSRKTKRLRAVYGPDGELIAALRASDLAIIPKLSILDAMPPGVKTVVVDDDAAPFIREGRSAFCRFVDSADPGIGARDEVAVRDLEGTLLAEGTAQVSGREMIDLSAGVAVKVRESIKGE